MIKFIKGLIEKFTGK
ncbi:alpha-1/alpha-2 family phenol-soluble modulin [Staphylococcus aureus]|nr:alpha-1/alpha-2 family phenol-soluble modulin [Staphylococcus aureus]